MLWREECGAVIPCLNEAEKIGDVVAGVRRHVSTVLVVDDGSGDATAEAARASGAEVLRHPENLGKGAALRHGLCRLHDLKLAWALTLDGDGQHDSAEIPSFLQAAETNGAALVVGNRLQDAKGMPFTRRFVNRWMSAILSRMAGTPLPDSQCGFRLLNLQAWTDLKLETAHFEVESEVVLAFVRAGLKVKFVPVRAIYKNERSKIHPMLDTVRWLNWCRKARR